MRKAVITLFVLSFLATGIVVLVPGLNSQFGLQLLAGILFPVGPPIALFLFLSPSLAMYSAALLPWALTKKDAPAASSLLRIGLSAGALLALTLPIASRFALWSISSQYGAEDVTLRAFQATPKKAVHVELMSPMPRGRGPDHSYGGGCDQLCQVILAEGLAEKVTVSHTRQRVPKFHRRRRSQRGNEPRQERREVFVQVGFKNSFTLKKGDVCPELYPKLEPIPAVVKLRAKGRCIVMTDPGKKWPTYSFRETELIDVDKKEAEFLTGAFESRRFEVMQRQGNDLVQIHAKTMVAAHPISLPFSYQPWHQRGRGRRGSFSRWLSRITAIVHRARHETRAFKFETEVVHWLQPFKSGQWPDVGSGPPPLEKYETVEKRLAKRETITSTELVQALLARPGPEPHGTGATEALRNWALDPLWRKKPDEDVIRTAIAVLRDRRFEDLNILPSSLARRPELFVSEISTILDRLESVRANIEWLRFGKSQRPSGCDANRELEIECRAHSDNHGQKRHEARLGALSDCRSAGLRHV